MEPLREMLYAFRGGNNSIKIVFVPDENASALKEKRSGGGEANTFLLKWSAFQKGISAQESKKEVWNVILLIQNGGKLPRV